MTAPRVRQRLVLALLVVATAVAAFVFRDALTHWFAGEAGDEHAGHTPAAAPDADDAPATHALDAPSLERARAAFAAYEQVRARLARDSVQDLPEQSRALASALRAAAESESPEPLANALAESADAADALGTAGDLAQAREAFAVLSERLVALAGHDRRLAEGLSIFECPMTEGYGKWFQPGEAIENPYMGQAMLQCGSASDWPAVTAAEQAAPAAAGDPDEVAYYTCSMHPSVRQAEPGKCPICGMDLTPVTHGEARSGTIVVDAARRQRIGVRIEPAERRPLTLHIRAVGEVRYDETRLTDVNLRVGGWVQKLFVDETGQRVRKGQKLLTLYSPELYAAQLEYLSGSRRQGEAATPALGRVAEAARQRLHLLGMSTAQIDALETEGKAAENVPVLAPAGGHVLEKNVVEGARIEAGTRVYRIADLSRIWVDAEVYESDLPHLRVGMPAAVELPYVPDRRYQGRIDLIYPTLQGQTRTGRVRVVLQNKDLDLKPQMYANVELEVALGERLVIPDSAVIYTGPRRLVFVDLGEGRLRPTPVELGVHAEGMYEVKGGLSAGDRVVTSGNFLIAAESRIRSAAEHWGGAHAGH